MSLTVRNKWHRSSFGRAFIVTLFFVTLASGLFWLDFFRSYNAEVTLLIIAKSGEESSSDTAENMRELSQTLSFYNRLLTENDRIDDDFIGYAPDVRKEKWHDLVSVTRQEGSGVLVIHANGDTPEKAKRIALQTAQTLFSVAGLYYDIKTGVDMRVVDGPFVAYSLEKPWSYVGTCLLTSVSLTAFFFLLLRIVPGYMGREKRGTPLSEARTTTEFSFSDESLARRAYPEFSMVGDAVPWIDPKKFVPEKPNALSFEENESVQEPVQIPLPEKTVDEQFREKKLRASIAFNDRNLPVADENSLPFTFETVPEEKSVHQEEHTVTIPAQQTQETETLPVFSVEPSEPTQEDYRRRLNELLAHIEK